MRRATPNVVAGLAALVAVAAVVAGLGGVGTVGATDHLSLSCADGDTGADVIADGGLTVSDDAGDASFAANPIVNDTALAFDNVTVTANGSASVVLETATAETVCVGAVDATGTPVTLAPDGFGSATVDGSLAALAYGPVDDANGTTDLAYNASTPVTVTLAAASQPGTPVRAVDADTGRTLADATVDADGTLELSLPAGVRDVDLRTVAADPGLSVSLAPESITANDSSSVAVTVTDPTSGTPVPGATIALAALGRTATTNASGVAEFTVAVAPGDYLVVASADGFRNGTATLTVTAGEPAVLPGAVYEPDSTAAGYDGAGGDRDGRIDIAELGAAGSDYATGELTIAELGNVAAAYARS